MRIRLCDAHRVTVETVCAGQSARIAATYFFLYGVGYRASAVAITRQKITSTARSYCVFAFIRATNDDRYISSCSMFIHT